MLQAAALLGLFCTSGAARAAAPLAVDATEERVSLGPWIDVLEDPGGTLTAAQAATDSRWRPYGRTDEPCFGFSTSAWWVRLQLDNPSGAPVEKWLEIAYGQLDRVDLFLPDGAGGLQSRTAGDLHRPGRSPGFAGFAFPLLVPPSGKLPVLLRIETRGVVWLPLALWSEPALLHKDGARQLAVGLFIGFIAALAIYNLFLFFTLRDRSYLFYVLYAASFLLASLVLMSVAAELFWPRHPELDQVAHALFVALGSAFAMLFAATFLGTRQRTPRVHAVLLFFAGLNGLAAVVAPFADRLSLRLSMGLLPVLGFAGIGAGVACLRRGFTPARYYLAAWSVLLVAVATNSLAALGFLPANTFTIYGYLGAGALEMVLLSFALANRISVLQRELALQREQMAQMQKLEAIGNLAGGIAHDFNNMLTAILGYASEIKQLSAPDDPVGAAAEVIERAGQRAAQLTRQLLGFARKGRRQDAAVDVRRLIGDVAALLARTVDKRIRITERVGEGGLWVRGDPSQLEQVLLNLAINARDAMPDGGDLGLEAGPVELDAAASRARALPAGRYVRFAVRDTGEGIAPEIRDRIFEPFFTTKPQGRGTGMGLATVHGIVHNHGGVVAVQSELSHGSTFEVLLPATEGDPAAAHSPDAPAAGNGRILVVDDEEIVREAVTTLLAQRGYEVVGAPDGLAALELLQADGSGVDLVLLDLEMPRMGGVECFREIRRLLPNVKIIVSSGHGPEGATQVLLDAGASSWLPKPYSVETLTATIARVLQRPSTTAAA